MTAEEQAVAWARERIAAGEKPPNRWTNPAWQVALAEARGEGDGWSARVWRAQLRVQLAR